MTPQLVEPQEHFVSPLAEEAVAALRARLAGDLLRPGDAGYAEARRVQNGLIDRHPALIARCAGTADVVTAVTFARDHALPLSVRGGGHNVAGNAVNDGGLVIDLSAMRGVVVDPNARIALVQGGATWADVDRETQRFGLATTGGQVSSTGVAGFTLHGGMGTLHRAFGLALDNLRAVEIVTADGQVRTASAEIEPELFWGVRGAGSNFGVVTRFEFALHPLGPEITMAVPVFRLEDAARVLRTFRDFSDGAPDAFNPQALFWSVPAIPDFPAELHGTPILVVQVLYAGDAGEGERLLRPVMEWADPVLDLSARLPYAESQSAFDGFFPKGGLYYWKSHLVRALTDEVIDAVVQAAADRPSPAGMINVWPLGGAVARVAPDATAWRHRDARYLLSLDTSWADPADSERCIAWTRRTWADLGRFAEGMYLNFAGLGEEKGELVRRGYGRNYERLVRLKRTYDPANLFRLNQNIDPGDPKSGA